MSGGPNRLTVTAFVAVLGGLGGEAGEALGGSPKRVEAAPAHDAEAKKADSARCRYSGVIPATGDLSVSLTRQGADADGLEKVDVSLSDQEQVLRTLSLAVAPSTGTLVPAVERRDSEAVWFFGEPAGLAGARTVLKGLRGPRADLSELRLGTAALTERNLADLEATEGLALIERDDQIIFLLIDTKGLAGIRFAVNDAVFRPEHYLRTARRLLQNPDVVLFFPQVGEGLGGTAGTCCINCGGQGTCCCSSTPCGCGDRACKCTGESCKCVGSGCECTAEIEY